MSIVMSLFLDGARMPPAGEWARAIRSHGFDVELPADFDPDAHAGFLPCRYGLERAGFEYFRHAVDRVELPDHVAATVAGRDTQVDFVTHSGLRELATSVIASAVLCTLADAVLWDTEADECFTSSRALDWARAGEADVRAALGEDHPPPG